ncbi:unnamed protein product [Arctogadus glacialis]
MSRRRAASPPPPPPPPRSALKQSALINTPRDEPRPHWSAGGAGAGEQIFGEDDPTRDEVVVGHTSVITSTHLPSWSLGAQPDGA